MAPDGSEVVFATPQTNGGPTSLLSVAVDLFNNVYAGYGTRPGSTLGAILKFTPGGAHQLVRTDAKQPTGLAAYPCAPPLYFADAERGTVAVVPISGQEKVIGFGLTDPTNLQCTYAGITGQDPGVPGGQFLVSRISFNFSYNFGNVAVGSSRSITLAAVTVGSDASGVAAGSATIWPAGGPNFLPNGTIYAGNDSGPGSVTDITLAFMPTAVGSYGPYAIQILDNRDENSFSGLETIFLSGTGVNPP